MKRMITILTAVVLFAVLPAAAGAAPMTSPLAGRVAPDEPPARDTLSLGDRGPLPTPTPSGPVAVVKIPTLNVRKGPGTGYPVLTAAAQNTRLPVLGQVNNCAWLKVQAPAGEGWVAGGAQYVSLTVGCASVPVAVVPKLVYHTAVGDVTLDESGFSTQWPLGCDGSDLWCDVASTGYRILYLYFIPQDGDAADLYDAWVSQSISVVASNGTRTDRWAAGFAHDRLMLAFTPSVNDRNFKLCFPGKPCLPIGR